MDKNKILTFFKNIMMRLGIVDDPEREESIKSAELINRIADINRDMEQSRLNYDFADDDTLIDMYIYTLKAQEMKYKHLLQKLRNVR